MIDAGYYITKTAKPASAIEIGVLVETRKKDKDTGLPIEGIVIAKIYDDDQDELQKKKKFHWEVQSGSSDLDNVQNHLFRSQQLKRKQTEDNETPYQWTAVENHIAGIDKPAEYNDVGVLGYPDFAVFDKETLDSQSPHYNFPFAELLLILWPGIWKNQLRKMNNAVRAENIANGKRNKSQVKEFTADEWWGCIGIIIAACPLEMGGVEKLFPNSKIRDCLPMLFAPKKISIVSKTRFSNFKHFPLCF